MRLELNFIFLQPLLKAIERGFYFSVCTYSYKDCLMDVFYLYRLGSIFNKVSAGSDPENSGSLP